MPVFPLPNLIVFPDAMMPLHIFELRYRTMVRDALSGERVIAMGLLKPGWERDYHGSPEFYPLGCLARFEEVEWLPNDCYSLVVRGLSRIMVSRVVREYPYRSARVEVLPQEPCSEDDPLILSEKYALLELYRRLLPDAPGAAAGAVPGAGAALAAPAERASASFHFMQIELAMGGVEGDTSQQAVQLRMRSSGQNQVQNAQLIVVDAAGANPVVLIDFASPVANADPYSYAGALPIRVAPEASFELGLDLVAPAAVGPLIWPRFLRYIIRGRGQAKPRPAPESGEQN